MDRELTTRVGIGLEKRDGGRLDSDDDEKEPNDARRVVWL
jgi:hypothetical protein